jgi:GNAT superfamily N-acetyltransferase
LPIEIRAATPDDARALVPLFEQLGYPTPEPVIAARLQAQDERTIVLVAVRGGMAAGFVAVAIQDDILVGERATVLGLVVDERERGGGIGAELLRAAEHWAFERGATMIVVRTNVIRERAHRFYVREGYRLHKTQRIFEKTKPPQG